MPAFRRVDQSQAGASAIGILVPPGQRTTVIVRPRALAWDLLPVRIDNGTRSPFCQFGRDEAAQVARRLHQNLIAAAENGSDPLTLLSNPTSTAVQIGIHVGDFYWLVCARTPGKTYEALSFNTESEALSAAQILAQYLHPPGDANQEVYFNTQHFK